MGVPYIYTGVLVYTWPRGLRHELSSLARTLGSCIRVPLKAWMSVCVRLFCVCVVLSRL
jgi:hypothetical protein